MPQKFRFLCGNFNERSYIYAANFGRHHWHYFDELHSIISQHESLPASLKNLVTTIQDIETIEVVLNDEQVKHYFQNGKFMFKKAELKTYVTLTSQSTKQKGKTTNELTFNSGETNPLLFLNEFDKSSDIKTDQDKTYKIRDFVDYQHKPEFSQLHFTSDWATVKTAFITKYSLPFIENKKKEINFNFSDEPNLRSFVHRKFECLTKYTTLSLVNQMEIILNELPTDIAHLFMVNEKFQCCKNDILDFCDAIQELVEKHIGDEKVLGNVNEPLNRFEVFQYDTDGVEDSVSAPMSSQASSSRGRTSSSSVRASSSRGRGGCAKGRGRAANGLIAKYQTRKRKLNTVSENLSDIEEDSEYDFVNQVSNSSQSSNSSLSSRKSFMSSRKLSN